MPANIASVRSMALAISAMSWATSVSTWGNRNWLRGSLAPTWSPYSSMYSPRANSQVNRAGGGVGGEGQTVGEIAVAGQGEGPGAVPFLLGEAESEQPQLVVEGHVGSIL